MPIYEYRCSACDHEFDKLQKLSDEPLKICPECGKEELKKLVSAAGFRLKGSGWYETDFKSKNQKNIVKSDKPRSDKPKPSEKKTASKDGK
ncbi:MAG: zinc ribbon domain-containing protein [Gammaproteobacteria bacterium]